MKNAILMLLLDTLCLLVQESLARSVHFDQLSRQDVGVPGRSRACLVIYMDEQGLTQQQHINSTANTARQIQQNDSLAAIEVWIACSRDVPVFMNENALALVRYAPDGKGWAGDKPEWTWEAWAADPLPTANDVRFLEAIQASISEYKGVPAAEHWAAVAAKL